MKFKLPKIKRRMRNTLIFLIIGGIGYGVYYKFKPATVTATYAVVSKVSQGDVSSGISASGQIMATNKLDLNVYKQATRIQVVNVSNGGHVNAGQIIMSFDKSSAAVSVESSKVALSESQLALQTQKANITDPNATLNTLNNDITNLKNSIAQAEKDKATAYRTFLNANLAAYPNTNQTQNKTRPVISGLYSGATEGTYKISVYGSGAISGYSYNVTGLENDTVNVLTNIVTKVGNNGLQIKFPSDVKDSDVWLIKVPNTDDPQYVQNKENYDKTITTLTQNIAGYNVSISNDELQIKNLGQTDNSASRNLDVSKAQAQLSQAQVQLSQNYNTMKEQDIVAPFSGTLEGSANVVVGATPTRDTSDTTNLGTLISDDFLVNFDLGAVDINKVKLGQKVLVSISSYPNSVPLEANITSISSLPNSSGVAQYTVQALINSSSTLSNNAPLREGLVADVEIVQQEKTNVIRIPTSAISYVNRQPTVQILSDLTADQQSQVDKNGVLKSLTGTFPSYPKVVTLGIVGTFYVEVTSGLDVNSLIIVSQTVKADTNVVTQRGFGGGGGNRGGGESAVTKPATSGSSAKSSGG
jgi:multidrug efflux pump subunit AcrA (membrane-fusion protein)